MDLLYMYKIITMLDQHYDVTLHSKTQAVYMGISKPQFCSDSSRRIPNKLFVVVIVFGSSLHL